MRGGKREGAGRPIEGTRNVTIRLTPEEQKELQLIGGSKWIRETLEQIREKKMTTTIDTTKFTEEEREAFIEGWEEAGGYMGDADSPAPWCCPWDGVELIEVTGVDIKGWGRQYWIACKPEIEQILAEEAAAKEADEE